MFCQGGDRRRREPGRRAASGSSRIGAAITLLTGRSVWFSGTRQVLIGLGAAALTFAIGRLIGVSLE